MEVVSVVEAEIGNIKTRSRNRLEIEIEAEIGTIILKFQNCHYLLLLWSLLINQKARIN